MSDELEPCPFCGCGMKLRTWNYLGAKYAVTNAERHKPWCCLSRVRLRAYDSPGDAIEAWNAREGRSE